MRHPVQFPKFLFDTIQPRWREDILRFIDSGDASEAFLRFLDENVECQRVVEIAFTLVSQDIATTARQLKESSTENELDQGDSMTTTFARLFTHLVLALTALDEGRRQKIMKTVHSWLLPQQQFQVMTILEEMGTYGLRGEDKYVS